MKKSATIILSALITAPFMVQAAQRPNVLLIISDDHSVPDLSCYGHPDIKSPNIDRLADEGVRFDRMYVTTPQSAPSRKSIVTGRGPIDLGVTRFTASLPVEAVTIMDVLGDSGYYTALMGRQHHLDAIELSELDKRIYSEHNLDPIAGRVDWVKRASDANNTKVFTEFLNKRPKNKPFFAELCYSDPHRPWTAPEFDPDWKSISLPPDYPDTELMRRDLANYYGEVMRVDQRIGEVLSIMDERGLMDNTVIFFIGDNGRSALRGKNTLFERGINVPFIIRWPNVTKEGACSEMLLSSEDIMPTILDGLGIAIPDDVTGISFMGALDGDDYVDVRDYVFAQRGAHGSQLPGSSNALDLSRVVVGHDFKLIYNAYADLPNYEPIADNHYDKGLGMELMAELKALYEKGDMSEIHKQIFATPRPIFQMYNLRDDPYELNNLYDNAAYATEQRALLEALQEWMILQHDFLPLPINK